jgi:hypothetical protein
MFTSKNHQWNTLFIILTAFIMITVSCSEDSTSANGDGETGDNEDTEETVEIDLSNISVGEALVEVADDTSYTWQGTASWDDGGRFNNRGTTYSEWIVTVTGENGEELSLNIVEPEESSSMNGPDDGTYEVGAGQTQNSLRLDTGVDVYLSENSTEGSFTVSQASDGSVLEIELEANGLEIGGIGSQDRFVDVTAAIKAERE